MRHRNMYKAHVNVSEMNPKYNKNYTYIRKFQSVTKLANRKV